MTRQKTAAAAPAPSTRWDRSHGEYLTGRAYLDGVDALAAGLEKYWGVDRLRLLVTDELRVKFDRQRYLYHQAIQGGSLDDVIAQSRRMTLAWETLDHQAKEAGEQPLAAEVWEVALENGTVAAIVQDVAHMGQVRDTGRRIAIYTLEEIAQLLAVHDGVQQAKLIFPGALVTRVSKSIGDPLDGIDQPTGFETALNDDVPPW